MFKIKTFTKKIKTCINILKWKENCNFKLWIVMQQNALNQIVKGKNK